MPGTSEISKERIVPVSCSFLLNNRETSTLYCQGFGSVKAFSGTDVGRDNPFDTGMKDIGPLPRGKYYLIDRQSGGRFGWLWDWLAVHAHVSTDHTEWFMLWNERGGDTTFIDGARRGNFRLHPMGPHRLSQGCITVVDPAEFNTLQRFIRSQGPTTPVPGSTLKAYGTVDVQ
jgi:hypothetical protein